MKTLSEPLKRSINTALGNVDNRLTEAQVKTANKLIDTAARTVYQQKAAAAALITDPEVANAFMLRRAPITTQPMMRPGCLPHKGAQ